MSVSFEKGAVLIRLQNPERGDTLKAVRQQRLEPRSDGQFYRYALAEGTQYDREISWGELRESEKNNLKNFFESIARGILDQFTFTDERGVAWNAHFLDPEIVFTGISDTVASSGTFLSGGINYPTTTREGGTFATRVRLRLWN